MNYSSELNGLIDNMLVPPGHGVFTVQTAKENKESLEQLLYGTNQNIQKIWRQTMTKSSLATPYLLGICSDCGGGIQRGANWGPLFIRENIYHKNKNLFQELGDIRIIPHLLHDKYLNQETIRSCRKALYGNENSDLPVSPLSMTEKFLDQFYRDNPAAKILSLGGDHSVSYPLFKSFILSRSKSEKVGLLHFDAHTDLLDKRLGIDLCFGSWTYHVMPYFESPQQVVQVGIRSTGQDRNHWESQFGLTQIWTQEVTQQGIEKIALQIIRQFEQQGVQSLYISIDIDAIDESYVSATGTPEPEGLAPYQIHGIIEKVAQHFPVTGADLVEVAPFVNARPSKTTNPEPLSTLNVAGDLAILLGEKLARGN